MNTADLDIIYFVKDGVRNEELRYSLRSVDANMPYKRVWIFGGCPTNIVPDVRVRVAQTGKTKWDRVRNMYKMVCENKEITDNFIMFNDDFFVMKPTDHLDSMYRCSLEQHIKILETRGPTEYSRLLRACLDELGPRAASFELHVPCIFNKKDLQRILDYYPNLHCVRTLYGNLGEFGSIEHRDVKIFNTHPDFDYKNSRFLSTDDSVVNINNDIWRWFWKTLDKKSRFEI